MDNKSTIYSQVTQDIDENIEQYRKDIHALSQKRLELFKNQSALKSKEIDSEDIDIALNHINQVSPGSVSLNHMGPIEGIPIMSNGRSSKMSIDRGNQTKPVLIQAV